MAKTPPTNPRLNFFKADLGKNKTLNATFEKAFADKEGDWPAIESALRKKGVPAKVLDKLIFTNTLAEWSGDNKNIVEAFQKDPDTNSLRDIAIKVPKTELDKKVTAASVPKGETKSDYTDQLYAGLYQAEPTAVVLNMIKDINVPLWNDFNGRQVAAILEKRPDFNIHTMSVYKLIKDKSLFKNIGEPDVVKGMLKALQSITNVSPDPKAIPVLLDNGFESAAQIASLPPKQFLAIMKNSTLPEEALLNMHGIAGDMTLRNEMALMEIHEAAKPSGIAFIDRSMGAETKKATASSSAALTVAAQNTLAKHGLSWDALFGDANFCECDDCTSVYSPASYYVELLQYLRNNNLDKRIPSDPKSIAKTPLAKLFNRRPDLGELKLTCENTNTILPYVDLVNEVMEAYVVSTTTKPYNVEGETSGELLSAPRYTDYGAYETLSEAVYPFTLPYHQPIDAVRIYLKYLGTSRNELFEVFRKPGTDDENETLERAIASEYLHLTEDEYKVLTKHMFDNSPAILKQQQMYYGYHENKPEPMFDTSAKEVGLTFVKKQFLPRTGIQYTDLIELLKANYINPNALMWENVRFLKSIETSYVEFEDYLNRNRYTKFLNANPKLKDFIPVDEAEVMLKTFHEETKNILVLSSALDQCNIDDVRLVRISQQPIQQEDNDYDKIQRFIRLWRKLGWTMAEVDIAIASLGGGDITAELVLELAAVKRLQERTGIQLPSLLCFWSNINSRGEQSLYQKLFLTHNLRAMDNVFDDPNGNYLAASEEMNKHLPVLMAALNVSSNDINAVFDLDSNPTTVVSIENVSLLYRYRLLSKLLGLSIPDFLKILSPTLFGDVFASPRETLGFLDKWNRIEASGLTVNQLMYLVGGMDNPLKPLAPSEKEILVFTKTIYDGLNAIETHHADLKATDPSASAAEQARSRESQATLEFVRDKASLLYNQANVDEIEGILEGTTIYSLAAPKNLKDRAKVIPATTTSPLDYEYLNLANYPIFKNKVKYDRVKGSFQFCGVLTNSQESAFLNLSIAGLPSTITLSNIVTQYDQLVEKTAEAVLKGMFSNVEIAFLMSEDVSAPLPPSGPDINTAPKKRLAFITTFLPYLREQLTRKAIVEAVVAAKGMDGKMTELLITEILKSKLTPFYTLLKEIKKPLSAAITWSGFLIPAATEEFTFVIRNATEKAKVILDGTRLNFTPIAGADPVSPIPTEWWSDSVKLEAGKVYPFEVMSVTSDDILWKTATTAIEQIPSTQMLPNFIGQGAFVLSALNRASMLVNGFTLTADEIKYFHSPDFGPIDFNFIDIASLLRLEAFTRLRNSLPQPTTNILAFWKGIKLGTTTAANLAKSIADLTNWPETQINRLTDSSNFDLNDPTDFTNEVSLLKLQNALTVADKIGVDIDRLFKWAVPSSVFDDCHDIAEDIQKSIRSRYKQTDWEQVVKPLNDELRNNQKEVLIAHLLQHPKLKANGVTDANGLFEYFLIDVQMDACMETSRVKQAISSVQLFVQRCFLGLEEKDELSSNGQRVDGVAANALDRDRWNWMQRYRVWEANRKVFLYPENWIESNLRDDKSPFFKELESELLQKDINKQNVTDALKAYLYKVDEVANMEVVGLHIGGAKTRNAWDKGAKLHVFSRTRNAPYLFYYRYLALDEMNWYPWEKLQVDIPCYDEVNTNGQTTRNGCHLTPVFWNGRLLIFFPQIVKQNRPATFSSTATLKGLAETEQDKLKPIDFWEIKMAWSEYRNGKWTQKQLSKDPIFHDNSVTSNYSGPTSTEVKNALTAALDSITILVSKVDKIFKRVKRLDTEVLDSRFWKGAPKSWSTLYEGSEGNDHGGIIQLLNNWSITSEAEHAAGSAPGSMSGQVPRPSYNIESKNLWVTARTLGDPDQNFIKKLTDLIKESGIDIADIDLAEVNKLATNARTSSASYFQLVATATANTLPSVSRFGFIPHIYNDIHLSVVYYPDLKHPFNFGFTGFPIGFFEFDGSTLKVNRPKAFLPEFVHRNDYEFQHAGSSISYESELFDDATFTKYNAGTFHHPYTHDLIGIINTRTIETLFGYNVLNITDRDEAFGKESSSTSTKIYNELKRPYSLYNWELFFHSPIMLANSLSKSNHFEEALNWFHYVFNPFAAGTDDKRVWQFAPFKDAGSKNVLDNIFSKLLPNTHDDAINEWRDKPFMPHVVARQRPVAYMKWVVMKYIDNLLAWGDHLFRQDTIESINQATQLYVLAFHILGERPMMIPKRTKDKAETYNSLLEKWDAFGNAKRDLEVLFPNSKQTSSTKNSITAGAASANGVFGTASSLYFCIPNNPKLLAYWDTLADRLFKIRHCQNIEGVFRKLPLFEPPIDPALLVNAAAQGLSLTSVLNDLNTSMPNYRFYYLLQKALELCGELKSLGGAILSAIEKKDNEAIASIRARHESSMHNLVMEIKKLQLDEAQQSLDSLRQNRKGPEHRMRYYLSLVGEAESLVPKEESDFGEMPNSIEKPIDESGLKLSKYEKEEYDKSHQAHGWQLGANAVEALAAIFHALPDAWVSAAPLGIGGSVKYGGSHLGSASNAASRVIQIVSSQLSFEAANAGKKGGFQRAMQDRIMQANAAGYEIKQIDKQILSQQIRIDMSNREIANQQKQIDNAGEIEEFLKNKYSNEELYSWMRDSLKTLYHQVYSLAFDLAKKAEKTYCFERGLSNSNFIKAGYFDASRDGLLAGEQLFVGLKQLEAAYQEKRGYDYEITKHISLNQLDPFALLQLKHDSKCEFEVPEALFDLDYPGHFMRRIKSVSISIPCVTGPYTGVNATLRLLQNKFRNSAIVTNSSSYPERTDETDERFSSFNIPITSIAAAHGQNDSGMFELNFKDERYLAFEGAGAVSRWHLELPLVKQFNYQTISDVILHLRYTSREGGDNLKRAAQDSARRILNEIQQQISETGLHVMISMKHDMPNEWNLMKSNHAATIKIDGSRLPYMAPKLVAGYKFDTVLFILTSSTTLTLEVGSGTTPKDFGALPGLPLDYVIGKSLGTSFDLKFQGAGASQQPPPTTPVPPPTAAELEVLDDLILVVKYTI